MRCTGSASLRVTLCPSSFKMSRWNVSAGVMNITLHISHIRSLTSTLTSSHLIMDISMYSMNINVMKIIKKCYSDIIEIRVMLIIISASHSVILSQVSFLIPDMGVNILETTKRLTEIRKILNYLKIMYQHPRNVSK